MRNKIQKSMILVIAATLLITCTVMSLFIYRQTLNILEDEARQEADYIRAAVDVLGSKYLRKMDAVRKNTRVTLIDRDGKVLYDSKEDDYTLENHKGRPEVLEALQTGSGSDIRKSDTLGQEMFYYAVQMSDGTILRISKTVDNALHMAMQIMPLMFVLAAVMLLFAWGLSRWQVARLIRPINELDLSRPLDNEIYEELTPLLERLDRQNKEKDAAANMRKEFSANVSHELKTPLTSISGYAEIMKDGLVKPENMQEFSERIYHEASRLITLVEDIIRLSRLDEGAVELEKEDVDLYALTREIVSRLAPQAAGRKVHIELTGEPVIYRGIRQILDEMVYNICENAVKYNKEGGTVAIWAGNTLNGQKIVVTDTGIGIPEDQQERIFERFYRVDKSHSRESGGTGLGLSIVKHGAMIHGVEIRVESTVEKGTRISLNF